MVHELELYKVRKQKCLFGVMVTAVGNLMRRSWDSNTTFFEISNFSFGQFIELDKELKNVDYLELAKCNP